MKFVRKRNFARPSVKGRAGEDDIRLFMCFDQTVSAVFSLINDVDLLGLLILVNEKFVADQVHLHDRFLCGHGLEVEGFFADLEFGFFFYGLKSLISAVEERAFAKSFFESCPTLCDSVDHNTPGFPAHHQLPELTQTHVH